MGEPWHCIWEWGVRIVLLGAPMIGYVSYLLRHRLGRKKTVAGQLTDN